MRLSRLLAALAVLCCVVACGGGDAACGEADCVTVDVNTQSVLGAYEIGVARCNNGQCDLIVEGGGLSAPFTIRVVAGDQPVIDGSTFDIVDVGADGIVVRRG